jgi:hypothetical protein
MTEDHEKNSIQREMEHSRIYRDYMMRAVKRAGARHLTMVMLMLIQTITMLAALVAYTHANI